MDKQNIILFSALAVAAVLLGYYFQGLFFIWGEIGVSSEGWTTPSDFSPIDFGAVVELRNAQIWMARLTSGPETYGASAYLQIVGSIDGTTWFPVGRKWNMAGVGASGAAWDIPTQLETNINKQVRYIKPKIGVDNPTTPGTPDWRVQYINLQIYDDTIWAVCTNECCVGTNPTYLNDKPCVTGYTCVEGACVIQKVECPFACCIGMAQYNDKGCLTDEMCQSNICVCKNVYVPVCGVNDMTFDNACLARQAGITVQYTGECKECITTADCDPPQVCIENKCVVQPGVDWMPFIVIGMSVAVIAILFILVLKKKQTTWF